MMLPVRTLVLMSMAYVSTQQRGHVALLELSAVVQTFCMGCMLLFAGSLVC